MRFKLFNRILPPPMFKDDYSGSVAKLLNSILVTLILGMFTLLSYRLVGRSWFFNELTRAEQTILSVIVFNFILLMIMRRGYVLLASIALILSTWVAITFQAWQADGVYDVSIVAYIITIVMASVLTNPRVEIVTTAMSILSIWIMAIYHPNSANASGVDTPLNYARDMSVFFVLVGAITYFLVRALNESMQKTKDEFEERIRAEQALRERDEIFNRIFQVSPVAINVTTLKDGKLVEANDAYWKLTGFDPATSLGKTTVELTIWDTEPNREKFTQELVVKKSLKNPNYEFINEKEDKKVTVAFSELIDSGGEPTVLSMFYDITDQVIAQTALKTNEEKYSNFVKTSIEGIYYLEFDEPISIHLPHEEQARLLYSFGQFVECNDALARIYGYQTGGDVRGLHLLDVLGGEISDMNFRAAIQLVRSGYRASNLEIEEKTLDGETRYFLSNEVCIIEDEHIVGLWGTQLDVTDLRIAQGALEQSEARIRAILEAVPDMIFELNGDGDILQFIPSSTLQPLLTPEEFLKKNISRVMPPDVVEQTMFASQRALESGLLQVFEYQLPEHTRQTYYEASVIRNDENSVIAMVRDVTARKWAATERENLIDELEKKNAELEQFTYTVSHDLKSPLITIRGFLGFIREDVEKGNKERLEMDMQRISDATEKMQKLLGDLLELSRVGRLVNNPEDADMNELVAETIELLHGVITQNNIQMMVSDELPVVNVDRQRIIEVLQNLIDNAAKFMGEQKTPVISVGQEGMLNGMPVLFVKDNGVGIAPEFKDRIFGLFNKLDARSDGTGIGLALVKRIIEFHGGRIWIESELGNGTTFFFTLPTQPMPER